MIVDRLYDFVRNLALGDLPPAVAGQARPHVLGPIPAVGGERHVGAAGVAPRARPLGLAVAHDRGPRVRRSGQHQRRTGSCQ